MNEDPQVKFPITWDLKGSMVGRQSGAETRAQKDVSYGILHDPTGYLTGLHAHECTYVRSYAYTTICLNICCSYTCYVHTYTRKYAHTHIS